MIHELLFVLWVFHTHPQLLWEGSTPVKILLDLESIMQLLPTQHIMTISIVTSVCVIGIAWIILYS